MTLDRPEHRRYTAERGTKILSSRFELILRKGEDFYLVRSSRATYITLDPKTLKPRLKLTDVQVKRLTEKSSPGRVKEAEIEITKGGPASLRPPSKGELLRRIDKGSPTLAPYTKSPEVGPHFASVKLAQKFFKANQAKLQSGLRKALERILQGRPDESEHHLKVKSSPESVEAAADITISGRRFVHLRYKASITPLGFLTIAASASVEASETKPQVAYRSQVVKDFFTAFVAMSPKLTRSFGLPSGVTIGPVGMKSNLLTPYLAVTRYYVTKI